MKGTLSARVTNDVTKRSKYIRIAHSNLGASVFETIYESPALKAANVLEWPSEVKEKIVEGIYAIQMAVVSDDASPVAVLSFDEMKTTSLQQLINGSGVSDAIKLVLKCEEEDPNAPKLSASDDMISPEKVETISPETAPFTPDVAAETPNAANRTPNTSMSRSGARIRITNTFTERFKNIRIGPSNLSDSIHDTIYNHSGIQASKILEWPAETEEALNTGLMEVQSFVEGTEISFSFAEMKSAPVSELLDLVSDETVTPLSIRAVGIPQGEDGERNASANEEAKKGEEEARPKEEEKAFWAAEEARLLAQAEERKRQKEGKMKATLAAEEAAKQKAQEEAVEKEAVIKAEEASRLARREAQKKAAMEAEKSARMEAEEERKYYEEQEVKQHNEGVEMLKSKRLASVSSEQLARSQAKSQGTKKREEYEEEARLMDNVLLADEEKDLDILESTAMLAADEIKELNSKEDEEKAQSMDKMLENDELGGAEYTAILAAEEVLELTQEEEARLRDAEEAHAMDAMLQAEEQQELVNLEQTEETAKGHRESTAILAGEELAELSRKEEDVLAEYDRKNAEEAAKGEAEYMAHREAEDAIRRSNEEELDRVLKAKEIEHAENERVEHERRENARMQALEERAAVIQQEALRPKKVDSPKDRTVRWEEARKRKAGVEGRLQKVEQNFVPDTNRKRSPDVVPLSLAFNVLLRKLRLALKKSKAYRDARQEMEAARCSVSKFEVFLGPYSLKRETP
jgi:hypothetical protein